MIEDTSVHLGKTASWTDLTSSATGLSRNTVGPSNEPNPERALIVYQNADEGGDGEVAQLLLQARIVLPAVMNYLYFNSTKVAVVYFGKRVVDGSKVGIRVGAEDFKIRMIRFLTTEIWPTLLRTDAPDESLGAGLQPRREGSSDSTSTFVLDGGGSPTTSPAGASCATRQPPSSNATPFLGPTNPCAAEPNGEACQRRQDAAAEAAQEISWFKKSIENHMQVLLYLKSGVDGTKYLKVILNNRTRRLHFDVADTKEEKYRWDLRMLYTRLLDNLETQKAIDSYESYERNFRLACKMADLNAMELERPLQSMTPVILWGAAAHTRPRELGQCSSADDMDVEDEDGCASVLETQRVSENHYDVDGNQSDWTMSPQRDSPGMMGRRYSIHFREESDRTATSAVEESFSSLAGSMQRSGATFALNSLPVPAAATAGGVSPLGPPPPRRHHDGNAAVAAVTGTAVVGNGTSPRLCSPACAGARDKAAGVASGDGPEGAFPLANDTFTALSRGTTLNPSKARYYKWMENLQRPESTTLDYKSYFSYTAMEIRHRCVKFMCGFLNAYREGKLVIGVHEIPRRDADGNLETGKGGRNTIVTHNDLVDQFVVGVRITEAELEEVQSDVSEQLLCCVPPIPPKTVSIDVIPVVFPEEFAYSRRVLVLYEENNAGPSRDALKQKSNYAIRFLNPMGLGIVPLDLVDQQLEVLVVEHKRGLEAKTPVDNASVSSPAACCTGRRSRKGKSGDLDSAASSPTMREFQSEYLKAEVYVIAAFGSPEMLTETDWEAQLSEAIGGAKSRCRHFFLDWPEEDLGPLMVPQLQVVEVSVDIKRCGYAPLQKYPGKFFTGWPSIPIWDAATRKVRRVERNYNIFDDASTREEAAEAYMAASGRWSHPNTGVDAALAAMRTGSSMVLGDTSALGPDSPLAHMSASVSNGGFQREMTRMGWCWFVDMQIVDNILAYLYGHRRISDVLQFRRVHPVWNRVFENRQGTPLVYMIQSTPVGVPISHNSPAHISRIQYAYLNAGVPPMPLILCRIYEIIGNLPSPYPFVTVPLVQQSFRVSSFLIPIFYRQHYFDGTMRISVVLDLRDGVLKTMRLSDGNLILEPIVGMCFEKMNRRQVVRQLSAVKEKKQRELFATKSRHHRRNLFHSLNSTPRGNRAATAVAAVAAAVHQPLTYAKSFLARRSLQPQMLRRSRGWLSSTILSPMMSESTRLTQREVEPNIPLIHFRFLTRALLEEGTFVVSDSPVCDGEGVRGSSVDRAWTPAPRQSAATPKPCSAARASWTLQHLLSWYHALLTDVAHVRFFGYGDRSIAFDVEDFSEICKDDVEANAIDAVPAEETTFAPCREACTLHRKVAEWMAV